MFGIITSNVDTAYCTSLVEYLIIRFLNYTSDPTHC